MGAKHHQTMSENTKRRNGITLLLSAETVSWWETVTARWVPRLVSMNTVASEAETKLECFPIGLHRIKPRHQRESERLREREIKRLLVFSVGRGLFVCRYFNGGMPWGVPLQPTRFYKFISTKKRVPKARTCLRACAVKFRFSDFILGPAQV